MLWSAISANVPFFNSTEPRRGRVVCRPRFRAFGAFDLLSRLFMVWLFTSPWLLLCFRVLLLEILAPVVSQCMSGSPRPPPRVCRWAPLPRPRGRFFKADATMLASNSVLYLPHLLCKRIGTLYSLSFIDIVLLAAKEGLPQQQLQQPSLPPIATSLPSSPPRQFKQLKRAGNKKQQPHQL